MKTLSPVEEEYLKTIKSLEEEIKEKQGKDHELNDIRKA